MPVDLDLTPQMGGAQSADPLRSVASLASIQNALNQNRMFQQQFAARQKAGQIMAASPDMESAFAAMARDPLVGPFAGDIVNSWRTAQTTLLGLQKTQQEMNQSGLTAVYSALGPALQNPTDFDQTFSRARQSLAPTVQSDLKGPLDTLQRQWSALAKSDPEAFRKSVAAAMLPSVPPDRVFGAMGGVAPQVSTVVNPAGQAVPVILGGVPQQAGGPGGGLLHPSSSFGIAGPGTEQQAQLTETGRIGAGIGEDMAKDQATLPSNMIRVQMMRDALQDFEAGGGANIRASAGKLVQALRHAGVDIDPNTEKEVGNGSLAAGDILNKLFNQAGVAQLRDDAAGTGKVMKTEVDTYMHMLQRETDPEAIRQIMNKMLLQMQIGYDRSQKWVDYKQQLASGDPKVKGLDLSDFYGHYNRHIDLKNLESPPGLDMSEIQPSGVRGAAESAGRAKSAIQRPPIDSFFK